jgi:hypothetical protein
LLNIELFITLLFWMVDEQTGDLLQHPQSKLHPSEIVTLALLKRLKGQAYRRFLVWLRNTGLFPNLPDYSRLCRLFKQYRHAIEVISRQIGQWDWTVADSILCEVIHPIREGRKTHWVGKNKSKGRWMVGIKVVVIVSPQGDILAWELDTANVHDKHFAWMVEAIEVKVLADSGFHAREGDPENLKICQRGEQNERMVVESVFSLCKRLLGLNNIVAKSLEGFRLAVASIFALFNTLLDMNRRLGLFSQRPSIAHFCCL